MEFGKLNNWLQVSANVGIVLGLVLVGVQLKQNSDLVKIQLLYEESRRTVDLELQVVGERGAEVWARSIEDPENLTLDEVRIMEALIWSFIETQRGTYRLAQLGLIDDEDWKIRVTDEVSFWFGNSYGAAWWRNYSAGNTGTGNAAMPPALTDAINARMQSLGRSTHQYITGPREFLKSAATGTE
ncbi:MAG TPA: hypothetical protein VIS31_02535 [Woeseiaceae bacterium]